MAKETRPRTTSRKTPKLVPSVAPQDPKPVVSAAPPKNNGHATPELESTIRVRAYELYERRGRQDGFDLDDWFQAEAEVLGQTQMRTA